MIRIVISLPDTQDPVLSCSKLTPRRTCAGLARLGAMHKLVWNRREYLDKRAHEHVSENDGLKVVVCVRATTV